MPEFLEYRYNALSPQHHGRPHRGDLRRRAAHRRALHRGHGARDPARHPHGQGVWIIGAIGTLYAATGGLKAIAYADLIQGLALLAGGMIIFFLGLHACGGWAEFSTTNADKLKLLLFKGHPATRNSRGTPSSAACGS